MKAELIPHCQLSEIETDSEKATAKALLDTLKSPWVIIHSLPWLKKQSHHTAEGEADFVLIHPEYGMLVIEVKGGVIRYEPKTGLWTTNNKTLKKSPFDQARRNMHQLLDTIKERCPELPSFVFGYAVVFPDCELSGNPPPGSDNHIQVGYSKMKTLGPFLETALQGWGKKPSLSAEHFQKLRRALMSDFKLVYAVQKDLETNEQLLVRLTEQQFTVLKGLDKNPRVTIEGAAGTGKTLMAIRRAEMFWEKGLKTLFLCFNRNLMHDISGRLADTDIQVSTFHTLVRELCVKAKVSFEPPDLGSEAERFWNEDAPELLSEALDELPGERYDAVLIDEAQDFDARWWGVVERLLKKKEGYLYIFFDRRQNLYGKVERFPACAARFDLTINCRNTRKIANACGQIIESEVETSPFAPEGSAVQVKRCQDRKEIHAMAAAAVKYFSETLKLSRGKIALLSPYSPKKSSLSENSISGIPTTSDLTKWSNNEAIWQSSIKGFKGLEADAIVLFDVGEFKSGFFDRSDLYVACSRAKQLLVVLTDSDEVGAWIIKP